MPYAHPFHSALAAAVYPGYSPFGLALGPGLAVLLIIAVAWSLIWQGIALWHAARNRQTVWFVVLLIVHTLGILDIIYLLFFRKDRKTFVSSTSSTTTTTTTSTTPAAPAPAPDSSATPN